MPFLERFLARLRSKIFSVQKDFNFVCDIKVTLVTSNNSNNDSPPPKQQNIWPKTLETKRQKASFSQLSNERTI